MFYFIFFQAVDSYEFLVEQRHPALSFVSSSGNKLRSTVLHFCISDWFLRTFAGQLKGGSDIKWGGEHAIEKPHELKFGREKLEKVQMQ